MSPRAPDNATSPDRLRLLILPALLLLLCGCGTTEFAATNPALIEPGQRALLLPLDETDALRVATDLGVGGITGAQGSGQVVARALSIALNETEVYEMVPREALYDEMHQRGLHMPELATIANDQAFDIARAAGAEVLILGEVRRCDTRWLLFIPKASVSFSVRAMHVPTRGVIWTGFFEDGKTFGRERELIRKGAERLAEAVADAAFVPEAD